MMGADFREKAAWLYGRTDARGVFRALCSDGSLAMLLYRAMAFCQRRCFLRPFAAVLCKLNAFLTGAVIGRGACFGEGFVILHGQGVVINARVRGGRRIYVESGVVIGESGRGCPRLGDGIFLGSGAKVFGAIAVGNNVTVGANAVVNRDVPDDVVVGGVPAGILRHKGADETAPRP